MLLSETGPAHCFKKPEPVMAAASCVAFFISLSTRLEIRTSDLRVKTTPA